MTAALAIMTLLLGINVFHMHSSNAELSAKQLVAADELMQSQEKLSICEKEAAGKETTLKEAQATAEAAKKLNEATSANLETCKASLQTATDEAAKAAEAAKATEAAKAEGGKSEEKTR